MLIIGEALQVGGRGMWGLYFPLLCAANLELFLKNNFTKLSDVNIGSGRSRTSNFQSVLLSLKILEPFSIN